MKLFDRLKKRRRDSLQWRKEMLELADWLGVKEGDSYTHAIMQLARKVRTLEND